ncbi:hypothetical protein [Mycobacterium leprae]|nr:hypothetical protein [Mycobacterium leprae]
MMRVVVETCLLLAGIHNGRDQASRCLGALQEPARALGILLAAPG